MSKIIFLAIGMILTALVIPGLSRRALITHKAIVIV